MNDIDCNNNSNNGDNSHTYPPAAMPRLVQTAHVREGSRVTIWWPAAQTYYAATVRKENPRKRENFQISYDGQPNPADREWIDLQRHRFRILQQPSTSSPVVDVSTRTPPNEVSSGGTVAAAAKKGTAARKMVPAKRKGRTPTAGKNAAISPDAVLKNAKAIIDSNGGENSAKQANGGAVGSNCALSTTANGGNVSASPTPDDMLRIVSEGSRAPVAQSSTLFSSSSSSSSEEEEEDAPQRSTTERTTGASSSETGEEKLSTTVVNTAGLSVTVASPTSSTGKSEGRKRFQKNAAARAASPSSAVAPQKEVETEDVKSSNTEKRTGFKTEAAVVATPRSVVAQRKAGDDAAPDDTCVTIDPSSDRSTRSLVNTLIGVGSRVAVYWDDDDTYYPATVTNSRSRGVPFFLQYDDGEEEWIDLRTHKFRILGDFGSRRKSISSSAENSKRSPVSSPPRRRKFDSPPISKATAVAASKTTRAIPSKLTRGSSAPTALAASPTTPLSEPRRTRSVDSIRIELPKKKSKRQRTTTKTEEPSSSAISTIRVGTRVAVWWPEDERYYVGTVQKERVHAKPFYLLYDEDDKGEWIDFQSHSFCVMPSVPPEGKKRGRKAKEEDHPDGDVKVGCSIAIWWSNISQYMDGTVTRKRGDSFFIKYEKQPGHWIELSKYSYRLDLEQPSPPTTSISREPATASSPKQSSSKSAAASNFLRNPNRDGTGKFTTKAAPDASSTSLLAAITVGTRVSVFWEGDSKYYKGVVTRERKTGKKRHFLEYDDGIGSHWIDFANHWIRILPSNKRRRSATAEPPNEPAPKKPKHEQKTLDAPTQSPALEVGSRLEVWWSGDEEYFKGTVTKQGKTTGKYFIDYDDGTKEWINVNHQEYRLIRSRRPSKRPTLYQEEPVEKSTVVQTKKRVEKVGRLPEKCAVKETIDESDMSGGEGENDYYKYDDFVLGAVDKIRVGSKISVWWTAEQRYFDCTLKKIDLSSRKSYFLVYDDADEEWTDLRRRYFRILKR